jgi:hypothetical protein
MARTLSLFLDTYTEIFFSLKRQELWLKSFLEKQKNKSPKSLEALARYLKPVIENTHTVMNNIIELFNAFPTPQSWAEQSKNISKENNNLNEEIDKIDLYMKAKDKIYSKANIAREKLDKLIKTANTLLPAKK